MSSSQMQLDSAFAPQIHLKAESTIFTNGVARHQWILFS